jgi:hypothetical protein
MQRARRIHMLLGLLLLLVKSTHQGEMTWRPQRKTLKTQKTL